MMKKNLTLLLSLGGLFMISAKCGGTGRELEPKSVITDEEKKEVSEAIAIVCDPKYKEYREKMGRFQILRKKVERAKYKSSKEEFGKIMDELVKLKPEAEKANKVLQGDSAYVEAIGKINAFEKNFYAKLEKMKQDLFKPSIEDHDTLFESLKVSAGGSEEDTDEE